MLKNNKIEIFYDKKDNLNVFIFHSVGRLQRNKSSVISATRQIDTKCKKDARDRLLRNRYGLLGYARFSPSRVKLPFLPIFFLILINVRVIKFFP